MNNLLLIRKKLLQWIMVLILLWVCVVIFLVVSLIIKVQRLDQLIMSSESIHNVDLMKVSLTIRDISQQYQFLQYVIIPIRPMLWIGEKIPGVEPHISQIQPLETYAGCLLKAAELSLKGIEPFLSNNNPQLEGNNNVSDLLTMISASQNEFLEAYNYLEKASLARSQIDLSRLPKRLISYIKKIDSKFTFIQAGIKLVIAIPTLGGGSVEQNYLIMIQNNEELRATGGFISAIGQIKVENGEILQMVIKDSYAVDDFSVNYPPPPEPISKYMLAGYWVPRDANWSPDFPTSAKKFMELYSLSTGETAVGVIAIDQSAIVHMVKVLGPLQIDGVHEPITEKNVLNWMYESWSPAPGEGVTKEWWLERKNFMGQLGKALVNAVFSNYDKEKILDLGNTVLNLIQTGHILAYFENNEAEYALQIAGIDGGIHPGNNDYIFLIDSNIGFNKVDAVINRDLIYTVDLRDLDMPIGELQITYHNQSKNDVECQHEAMYGDVYQDLQYRCYWDYWRVLTNSSNILLNYSKHKISATDLLNKTEWDGIISQADGENGTLEFSGLMVLPPHEKQVNYLEWRLPKDVVRQDGNESVYNLRIQKQPGILGYEFVLRVLLPDGFTPIDPEQNWQFDKENDQWILKTWINKSEDIFLVFRQ